MEILVAVSLSLFVIGGLILFVGYITDDDYNTNTFRIGATGAIIWGLGLTGLLMVGLIEIWMWALR